MGWKAQAVSSWMQTKEITHPMVRCTHIPVGTLWDFDEPKIHCKCTKTDAQLDTKKWDNIVYTTIVESMSSNIEI